MNAIEFLAAVDEEVKKLGPYSRRAIYATLPAEECTEVSIAVTRDPHHGETDFYTVGGKRIRRHAVETGYEAFVSATGTAVGSPGGRFIEQELEPLWRSPALDFEYPWPAPVEAAKDLDNAWVASRARGKLSCWASRRIIRLDTPVDGFNEVSWDEMDRILRTGGPSTAGWAVAVAASKQVEDLRHLADSDQKFTPIVLEALVRALEDKI